MAMLPGYAFLLLLLNFCGLSTYVTCQETDVCSPLRQGGAICTCNTTSSYNCSGRGLKEVPYTFAWNTTGIILSHNSINTLYNGAFINSTFSGRFLEYLYLDNNNISVIKANAFNNLMQLKYLYLNNNKLTSLSNQMFEHLASLEVLDLSNNEITFINRYSFFTNGYLSIVHFDGNPLYCGCEARLLREFLQERSGLVLDKARCSNLNNSLIGSLSVANFPSCNNGETLFIPSTCYMCADAPSLTACSQNTRQNCTFPKAVCYSQVDYNSGHLGVWGGCMDYYTCLLRERNNRQDCVTKQLTSCNFCSLGSLPNAANEMRTTKEFRLLTEVTLDATMATGLNDTQSAAYQSFTWNLATEVYNHLNGQKGAFIVDFVKLSTPAITMTFKINCSTIWYNTRSDVRNAIKDRLLNVRFNGYNVNDVYVTEISANSCASETMVDSRYGTFDWPGTLMNAVAIVQCPYQLSINYIADATRLCRTNTDGTASWDTPNMDDCGFADQTARQIQELSKITITNANVVTVASNISSLTTSWQKLDTDTVTLVTNVVQGILGTSVSKTSRDVISDTLSTINNVMFVGTDILSRSQTESQSSTRILKSLDQLLQGVDVSGSPYNEVKDNVAGHVTALNPVTYQGYTLSIKNSPDSNLSNGQVNTAIGETVLGPGHSGIVLPGSLFRDLNSATPSKVSMSIIQDAKLFRSIFRKNDTRVMLLNNGTYVTVYRDVNSYVLGATVAGLVVRGLSEPVKVTFLHRQHGDNATCVFWDEQTSLWLDDGCTLNSSDSQSTVCHCSHLTNFALLMDVYGTGGGLSDGDRLALEIISYVGCAVSLLAIILTLITYIAFKKLRRDNPSKILMNLCVAIGLADLVFLAGMQDFTANSDAGCKLVAVLLHYFLLAAMCWMAVEAFYMYMALVKIFDAHVERFQLKSSVFGWVTPLVIVICTIAIKKTDNYGVQPGGICWLEQKAFYGAFLGPVCLILIVNLVVFVLVLRQILRRSSNTLSRTDRSKTAIRLRGAVSLIILLGLTWLFGIFAVDNYGIVFHYLFAIFNSLQGFFIFIFYCLMKTEAQQSWKAVLPCFKSPYEADKTTAKGFSNSLDSSKTDTKGIPSATTSTTISSDSQPSRKDNPTAFRGRWQFAVQDHDRPRNAI